MARDYKNSSSQRASNQANKKVSRDRPRQVALDGRFGDIAHLGSRNSSTKEQREARRNEAIEQARLRRRQYRIADIVESQKRKNMIEEPPEELTQDDLRERSEKLSDLQEMYTEIAYVAEPKMPCNECGGGGSVDAGSLGNICVKCMGAKVINQPFCEPFKQPPFKELRASITNYGNLLEARGRGEHVQLPPASTVFGKEQYNELFQQGKAEVRILAKHEEAKRLQSSNHEDEDDGDIKPW